MIVRDKKEENFDQFNLIKMGFNLEKRFKSINYSVIYLRKKNKEFALHNLMTVICGTCILRKTSTRYILYLIISSSFLARKRNEPHCIRVRRRFEGKQETHGCIITLFIVSVYISQNPTSTQR